MTLHLKVDTLLLRRVTTYDVAAELSHGGQLTCMWSATVHRTVCILPIMSEVFDDNLLGSKCCLRMLYTMVVVPKLHTFILEGIRGMRNGVPAILPYHRLFLDAERARYER